MTHPSTGALDRPGSLQFHGTYAAELFSRVLSESFAGVLGRNYYSRFEGDNAGFVSASVDGRPWTDTMWTRDTGVFLRELVHWGYLDHACLTAECLMRLVRENEDGFMTFPEHFSLGEPGAGSELDGTNAIVISMVLLWRCLPETHPIRAALRDFLCGSKSPVTHIERILAKAPLLPGSGEFGGGCAIPGLHYNIVQNYLGVYALTAVARMREKLGENDDAARLTATANRLEDAIAQYLVSADESWTWCVDLKTLQPDPAIVGHSINKGFGGLNGVAAMASDVFGFAPDLESCRWYRPSLKTFERLAHTPLRRKLFEQYGIWTQFDESSFWAGMERMMSPSYGHGYALQTMLLFDRMEMAERALTYFAEATFQPPRGYRLDRDNPYHIYERYVAPGTAAELEACDQGCGALNLVCVVEPLKVGRMVAGCDDTDPNCTRFVPRLPKSWRGCTLNNWPLHTAAGMSWVDATYERAGEQERLALRVVAGEALPNVEILFGGRLGTRRYSLEDVREVDVQG